MSTLYIAAAGAGKTTYMVDDAFRQSSSVDNKILITTFTDNNTLEIKQKFYSIYGFIPHNIDILPWFTFLLRECVRPYQQFMFTERINGLHLVDKISAKEVTEKDVKRFFFDEKNRIYSDKLANFAFKLNRCSEGLSIKRLYKLYTTIFIDEIQDMAGYDFELIKILHEVGINIIMAGDPRQTIFPNHPAKKNKKYFGHIDNFIRDNRLDINIDTQKLHKTYRNNPSICNFANKFYPEMQPCESANMQKTVHDGIFIVKKSQVRQYYDTYHPAILRDSKKTMVDFDSSSQLTVYNFMKSKGLGFDRVLIYPTNPLIQWIKNQNKELKPQTRAKSYVAVTRACFSVAFVVKDKDAKQVSQSAGIPLWTP